MYRKITILFFAFAALFLISCKVNQTEKVGYSLSFSSLYDSVKAYDSVTIILKNDEGNIIDTVFRGKVKDKSKIENLEAPHYDGGKTNIFVTGLIEGKVIYQIKKKYDGSIGKTDSLTLIISPNIKFSVLDSLPKFKQGDSTQLPRILVTPENLADKSIEWSSSNPGILTIDGIQIKGISAGTATLLGKLKSDPSKTIVIVVIVLSKNTPIDTVKPPVDSIRIPIAPKNFFAIAGDAKVSLTWDSVPNADSYNIFYAEGALVDKASTHIVGATSPIQIDSLKNGKIYSFSITAINKAGESNLGPIKSATPQASAPSAPTLNSIIPDSGKVTLDWTAVTGAATYSIYYTSGTTLDTTGTKVSNANSPAEITGLINGTAYKFAVVAFNDGGKSAMSNIETATPVLPSITYTVPILKEVGIDTANARRYNVGYNPVYSFSIWPLATYFSLFQFDLSAYSKPGFKSARIHFKTYASGNAWVPGPVNFTAIIYRLKSPWVEGTGNWFWSNGSWANGGQTTLLNYPLRPSISDGSTNPADTTTGINYGPNPIMKLSNLTFVDSQKVVMNLKPGNITGPLPATVPIPVNLMDFSFDFSKYVNPILAGSVIDYGFVILVSGIPRGNDFLFTTKELGDGSYGATLVLSY